MLEWWFRIMLIVRDLGDDSEKWRFFKWVGFRIYGNLEELRLINVGVQT